MPTLNPRIGARVRELRQALGFSLVEAAMRAKMRDTDLHRIEAGAGELPDLKFQRLAQALGVTTTYLLGQEDDNDELEASALFQLFKRLLMRCDAEKRRRILIDLVRGVQMEKNKR